MGACGLMYEYVLSVLGNHLMGTSHEQIFIIIGMMLFAMGVGALLQRMFRRNLIDTFLLLEIALGLLGGFSGVAIYGAYAFWESFQVVLYGFALLIGLAIGMEIPLLIRINRAYARSLRTNLSEILSVDYIGSLAGAFLFTYVLLARVPLSSIGFLLGAVNVSVAIASLVYFRQVVRRPYLLVMVAAAAAPALGYGALNAQAWTEYSEQRLYRDPIIFRKTTRFQHIVLTKRGHRLNLYLNGNLQFSSLDEQIYHDYLVHVPMSAASSRARVLILGGGDGLALREVLKYPDVRQVVLVDIDPEVVRISSSQPDLVAQNKNAFADARVVLLSPAGTIVGDPVPLDVHSQRRTAFQSGRRNSDQEVRLFFIDADLFLAKVPGQFDVVLIDFPDPSMLELAKLYSLDFYRNLAGRLAPGAVVAVQSTSPFFARKAFTCIGQTLSAGGFAVLPYHGSVPTFAGDWGWHLAWRHTLPADVMLGRVAKFEHSARTAFITPALARSAFLFGKGMLDAPTSVRINTKMRPVLVEYYRDSWPGFD